MPINWKPHAPGPQPQGKTTTVADCINQPDNDGHTPMSLALAHSYRGVVEKLIQKGADVHNQV